MKINQSKPFLDKQEYDKIKECFDTDWLTEGPLAKEFTDKICNLVGSKYGVLAPNGTLALYLGLRALGIGEGDEVIVPNFTFIASANAIIMAGAKPVFVDVKKEDLHIDLNRCVSELTSRTAAIMPVHMYGAACNMDEVVKFAGEYGLKVIEDACQAVGVKWKDKGCGSWGNVGCFSFFADKSITTIEGGFVATDDSEIFEKLLFLRNQGRTNRGTFIHPEIGFNFRMDDIHSAIGLVQLEKAQYIFARRQENHAAYLHQLQDLKQIRILQPPIGSSHIPFRTIVFCEHGNQQDLSDFLKDRGIETRTLFYPLHKQPCYYKLYGLGDQKFSNSIWAFDYGFCLPVHPLLTLEEITYICDAIKEYYHV